MAKRRRPDPAITDKWFEILRADKQKLDRRLRAVDEAQDEMGEHVREAFGEGMLVGPMKDATGKSGSRLYQLKFQLRDQERENTAG